MIFMRPKILRDKNDAMLQTNSKYNFLRAQQIEAEKNGFGLLKDEKTPLLPKIEKLATSDKTIKAEDNEQDIEDDEHF